MFTWLIRRWRGERVLTMQGFASRIVYLDVDRWSLLVLRNDPCCYCGGASNTVEHLTPKAYGGTTNSDNLVGACSVCNSQRGVQPFLLYVWWLRGQYLAYGAGRPTRKRRARYAGRLRVTIGDLIASKSRHAMD